MSKRAFKITIQLKDIKMSHIQKIVANEYGYKVEDLKNVSRKPMLVYYRHITMYLCRQLTSNSLTQIAYAFNRTNHTTIINAVRNVEELCKFGYDFAQQIEELKKKIIDSWNLQNKGL